MDPQQGTDVEPTASNRAVPAILFAVLAALLFWGDRYVMNHGGDLLGKGGSFPEEVYYPVPSYAALQALNPKGEASLLEEGQVAYQRYCQACHQPSGMGQAGMFPPLADSDWVVGVGPNRLIRLVLDGIQGPITVNGQQYNNVMVPWRDTMTDREIAAVLTFIRNNWGNSGSDVAVEKVSEIREATASRAGTPWTADQLLQIPDSD